MADPILIDAHLHIMKSKEDFEGYQVWEYGEKSDVKHSKYDGDVEDALDAIDKAGFSKAVVVNLFYSPGRKKDADLAEELKAYNRWGCDTAAPHDSLVPYFSADPYILPGEEMSAHVRDMVENHGARGVKLHPVIQRFEMGDPKMTPTY